MNIPKYSIRYTIYDKDRHSASGVIAIPASELNMLMPLVRQDIFTETGLTLDEVKFSELEISILPIPLR